MAVKMHYGNSFGAPNSPFFIPRNLFMSQEEKTSLVWSPAPDSSHVVKGNSSSSPSNAPPHSQGLAHWMSVMAEHMTSSVPHHDVHYMWNGVEAKMNPEQLSSLQKGPSNSVEDSRMDRLDSGHQTSSIPPLYGAPRSNSSNSSSPPAVSSSVSSSGMLIVPQPINAVAKGSSGHLSHSSTSNNGSGRKYQCKMCPQIFMHKSAMQLHAREAHRNEVKPHQCQQCLKSFSSNHQLVQHTRVHTGEKPYKCSYCDRRFKQLSHVQQHTRLHTGERPYKCHLPDCGRAFIQLSNLQQHLRNHDSQVERARNRPFHCNICGKGFATESSLRTHISKQHAALVGGPNAQSCPVCHKLCPTAEALMEHMKYTHKDPTASGVASLCIPAKRRTTFHPCPVCGKHYVNEGSLRKHLACHPETNQLANSFRVWPCSVCQAVFTHETGLLNHMETLRMDPKHQFAAQYVLSRAAAERRERENLLMGASTNGAHMGSSGSPLPMSPSSGANDNRMGTPSESSIGPGEGTASGGSSSVQRMPSPAELLSSGLLSPQNDVGLRRESLMSPGATGGIPPSPNSSSGLSIGDPVSMRGPGPKSMDELLRSQAEAALRLAVSQADPRTQEELLRLHQSRLEQALRIHGDPRMTLGHFLTPSPIQRQPYSHQTTLQQTAPHHHSQLHHQQQQPPPQQQQQQPNQQQQQPQPPQSQQQGSQQQPPPPQPQSQQQ